MKWSYHLARIAGIDTRVHASFGLLLLWVAVSAYRNTGSLFGAGLGLVFVILMFGAVLLHELGHALTARHYGIPTRAITLYPIGGVAEIMGPPRTPKQEIAIAVAGPAVNFVLAALFGLVSLTLPETGLIPMFVSALAWANLGLGLFNLLPAFPMDGGRVLRAALTGRYGPLRATVIAAGLGKVAAVGLFIAGFFGNPWLMFIAPVLWFIGDRELKAARIRSQAGARAMHYEAASLGETFVIDRHGRLHRVVRFVPRPDR